MILKPDGVLIIQFSTYMIPFLQTTEFDSTPVPNVNEPILNEIASDFLSQLNSTSQVKNLLNTMSIKEKLVYSGENLIGHYGCYSCHNIQGFEDRKPIGISLNSLHLKILNKFIILDNIQYTEYSRSNVNKYK